MITRDVFYKTLPRMPGCAAVETVDCIVVIPDYVVNTEKKQYFIEHIIRYNYRNSLDKIWQDFDEFDSLFFCSLSPFDEFDSQHLLSLSNFNSFASI